MKKGNFWAKASNQPNVVRPYGACASSVTKTPYFVFEYAANGTLKNYVDSKKSNQIWKLLLSAANGLMSPQAVDPAQRSQV